MNKLSVSCGTINRKAKWELVYHLLTVPGVIYIYLAYMLYFAYWLIFNISSHADRFQIYPLSFSFSPS